MSKRDILFRGKRRDGCGWCYGAFISVFEPEIVGEKGWLHVDQDTVGQFTGLTDANRNRIFENDIVTLGGPDSCGTMGVVHIGEHSTFPEDESFNFGVWVEWFYGPDGNIGTRRQELLFWTKISGIEVCGNIHDNPELLNVSQTSHAEDSRKEPV